MGRFGPFAGIGSSSDCLACPKGRTGLRVGASVMEDCTLCPGGTYGNEEALYLPECSGNCTPGKYSFGGLEQCLLCPLGRISPTSGMAECTECTAAASQTASKTTTLGEGETECVCVAGHYRLEHATGFTCALCIEGMECDKAGATTSAVELGRGYWRHDNSSNAIQVCPVKDVCRTAALVTVAGNITILPASSSSSQSPLSVSPLILSPGVETGLKVALAKSCGNGVNTSNITVVTSGGANQAAGTTKTMRQLRQGGPGTLNSSSAAIAAATTVEYTVELSSVELGQHVLHNLTLLHNASSSLSMRSFLSPPPPATTTIDMHNSTTPIATRMTQFVDLLRKSTPSGEFDDMTKERIIVGMPSVSVVTTTCALGHSGPMCMVCDVGYSRWQQTSQC